MSRPREIPLACLLAALVVAALLCGPAIAGVLPWPSTQPSFVLSLASSPTGQLWVGTEDGGVWRYDPGADPPWRQFTTRDGLGDDSAYALAIDPLGRVWVGHLNHGVSVYNGTTWRNYDQLTGPLGARVFDIAVRTGDTIPNRVPNPEVWIATDLGVARYDLHADTWIYLTRADGLPSDQITAITFNEDGEAVIGTDCHGIVVLGGGAADGQSGSLSPRERAGVRASAAADPHPAADGPPLPGGEVLQPGLLRIDGPLAPTDRPIGDGLPSPLINDLLTARDGTIYAATCRGIAWSADGGRHWHYRRGHDWQAKLRGLEKAVEPTPYEVRGALLAEDYVTCLAEDADGRIWVGHRQWAYEAFDQVTFGREASFDAEPGREAPNVHPIFGRLLGDNVAAILCRPGERPLVAWYGGGLSEAVSPGGVGAASRGDLPLPPPWQGGGAAAPLPSPARAPDAAETAALQAEQPVYLGDDWTTQGDWVGRYGREYALLCAMAAPLDHPVSIPNGASAIGRLGPHHAEGDRLRRWVHWPTTDNPKSLYDPVLGYRRQADWDDHGETYPMAHEGPGLRLDVTVPAGLHRVSLYFLNKDGHEHVNRNRDYLIEWGSNADAGWQPALRARVHGFWGGVYKQVVCRGPARYEVRIERNDSLNTILQGVFIDRLSGSPSPTEALPAAWLGNVRYEPPPGGPWDTIEPAARILAYRAAVAAGEDAAALARRRWAIPLWDAAERAEFATTMARARQALLASNKPAAP